MIAKGCSRLEWKKIAWRILVPSPTIIIRINLDLDRWFIVYCGRVDGKERRLGMIDC